MKGRGVGRFLHFGSLSFVILTLLSAGLLVQFTFH